MAEDTKPHIVYWEKTISHRARITFKFTCTQKFMYVSGCVGFLNCAVTVRHVIMASLKGNIEIGRTDGYFEEAG